MWMISKIKKWTEKGIHEITKSYRTRRALWGAWSRLICRIWTRNGCRWRGWSDWAGRRLIRGLERLNEWGYMSEIWRVDNNVIIVQESHRKGRRCRGLRRWLIWRIRGWLISGLLTRVKAEKVMLEHENKSWMLPHDVSITNSLYSQRWLGYLLVRKLVNLLQ